MIRKTSNRRYVKRILVVLWTSVSFRNIKHESRAPECDEKRPTDSLRRRATVKESVSVGLGFRALGLGFRERLGCHHAETVGDRGT